MLEKGLNVEGLVHPAGHVFGDLSQLKGSIVDSRVLEVDDAHFGAVSQVVREIAVPGPEDWWDVWLISRLHARVVQPGRATVHGTAHLVAGLGLSLRRPRANLSDELLLMPWPARNCGQRIGRHRDIEPRQRRGQRLDVPIVE